MIKQTVEVELKEFLNQWKETDHYLTLEVDSVNRKIGLIKRVEESNRLGVITEYYLKTTLCSDMYFHDTGSFWQIEKGKIVKFFLTFEKAETLIFALEFYNRLKNANMFFRYYIFMYDDEVEEKEEEKCLRVELLKICIDTKKKRYICNISNFFHNNYGSMFSRYN